MTDIAHHLGFEWRGAGEADRAASQLLASDARRLVRLDVGPQRETVLGCVACRPVEISAKPVEVDHRYRRFKVGKRVRHGSSLRIHDFVETITRRTMK